MKTSNLLVMAMAGMVGCGYPGGGYNNQPSVPLGAPTHLIAVGAGTFVDPGFQAGYGITANFGSSFRLVWTGDAAASGTYSVFEGSVFTPGHFLSQSPGCGGGCALEGGDYVSQPLATPGGERIDFNTTATTGLDGFDFVSSAEPVYFDLLIDGRRYPELVFFTDGTTGQMSSSASLPFGLYTQ